MLATTCIYDTRKRKNVTLVRSLLCFARSVRSIRMITDLQGGYEIVEEMCVNYVHYYPKSDVEVCKSAIDNSTLSAYFRRM